TDSTGNLNFSGQVQSGDVHANTFRVVANNVTAAGFGGLGAAFDHNVEMWANNDLNPGSFGLTDNRNLTLIADRDNNQSGNVLLSGSINVGATTGNTGSMTVTGENISVLANGNV